MYTKAKNSSTSCISVPYVLYVTFVYVTLALNIQISSSEECSFSLVDGTVSIRNNTIFFKLENECDLSNLDCF